MSAPAVVGDGTSLTSRAGSRWRRWRLPLGVVGLLAVVALAAALPEPRTSLTPLAPDNATAEGARAAAQILEREGVHITYVRSTAAAARAAKPGSTLLVTNHSFLTEDQTARLGASGADLVLVRPEWALAAYTSAAADAGSWQAQTVTRSARCSDPDATAAGTLVSTGNGFVAHSGTATVCFADAEGIGAYVVVADGARRITAIDTSEPLTNRSLATEGNAALTLRMLGRNRELVWYVPSYNEEFGATGTTGVGELLPPWTKTLALQLLVVVALAALWRGRRMGPLVTEPLPVVVRSAEVTRGRGRLYRRSRSYGHAAAALRAGTASRAAARLGLPRSAGATDVIDALVRATGRDRQDISVLLYGPPPDGDADLTRLARQLDRLESEVHRP